MYKSIYREGRGNSTLDTSINDRLALVRAVNNCRGNLVHLKDEIYGFVDNTCRMRIVSSKNWKVTDDYMVLEYITDHTIILADNRDLSKRITSRVINRETFDTIHILNGFLHVCNDIIYQENLITNGKMTGKNDTSLLDLEGNLIYETSTGYSLNIYNIPDTDLYVINSAFAQTRHRTIEIVHYDKKENKGYRIFYSDEWTVEEIAENTYIFTNNQDCDNVRIINLKEIDRLGKPINLDDYKENI
jgi:hypothetical protein